MLLQISSCLLTAWVGPPVEILPRQWWLLIWLRSTTSPPPRSSFPLTATLEDAHADLIARSAQKTSLAGLGTMHCDPSLLEQARHGPYWRFARLLVALWHAHPDHPRSHAGPVPVWTRARLRRRSEHHPKRNVIMRNIGDTPEPLEIDKSIREAIVGDRWLLCSDACSASCPRNALNRRCGSTWI